MGDIREPPGLRMEPSQTQAVLLSPLEVAILKTQPGSVLGVPAVSKRSQRIPVYLHLSFSSALSGL